MENFRDALGNLAGDARSEFRDIWESVKDSDISSQRDALIDAFPEIIAKYGEMSAAAASDVLEDWLGGDIDVKTAAPVDADHSAGRMRWALGTDNPSGNLEGIVDELVQQPGRSTVIDTAEDNDGVGWIRMAEGDACAFCQMMASRDAKYTSKETAGAKSFDEDSGRYRGDKFHDNCRCELVAVRSDDDIPEGYQKNKFSDRYENAKKADSDKERKATSDRDKILTRMREDQPGIH